MSRNQWNRPLPLYRMCHFNDDIECTDQKIENCSHCGWYPPECERRKEQIRAERKKAYEEAATTAKKEKQKFFGFKLQNGRYVIC